ncbi:MAG: sensor domain-containing diguanylate cyclase [Firmicutes bacterium]|nr:sensor domain-containing diguanylate cyclase [Bacillota bacterium]
MSRKSENILYLIVGSLGILTFLYVNIFTNEYKDMNIILFLLLVISGLVTEKIHIRISEFTVTLDSAIMLGAYFMLGLKPTLWLITILFIFSGMIFHSIPKRKIILHASMFILIFAISHYAFKYTGFLINAEGFFNILKCIIFGICVFSLNWCLLFIQIKSQEGKLPEEIKETFIWDFYTNFIVIPLSILLTLSYNKYSYGGIIIYLTLIISANFLFRLIRNLTFINRELKVVQNISLSISSRLDLKETTSSILKGVNELAKCDYCSILQINNVTSKIETLGFKKSDEIHIKSEDVDKYMTKNIRKVKELNDSFVIEDLNKSELFNDFNNISKDVKSILYEPLMLKNDMIGCLLICSKNQKHFTEERLDIIDTLANQAVIAMENARLYKEAKTKAIRDALTGLYNQRYFYDALEALNDSCGNCSRKTCINCNSTSLIIFDIDFFKVVNDTYGHQTGDKILKEVARVIKENVRKQDLVSRYGGEEFTILLPNTKQESAYVIADRIREIIESHSFYSLNGEKVKLTISGGVSEFPYNADSGSSLLAYADRAMYTGSKQKGRNKISTYAG